MSVPCTSGNVAVSGIFLEKYEYELTSMPAHCHTYHMYDNYMYVLLQGSRGTSLELRFPGILSFLPTWVSFFPTGRWI